MIGHDAQRAARLLAQGEVVALPTETVYGLAANALDASAVARIFEVKNRPHFDPLIIHCLDSEELLKYTLEIPKQAHALMERFWPGPLTMLLPRNDLVPDLVCAGLEKAAFRLPAHPLFREVLKATNLPLAAPSANPFSYVSPTTAQHVEDQLGRKIPYILDGGSAEHGLESTIVDFEGDRLLIKRLGALSAEDLHMHGFKVEMAISSSAKPNNPGSLDQHYATQKPLYIQPRAALLPQKQDTKAAYLLFREALGGIDPKRQVVLSPEGSLKLAAMRLFAQMRNLDEGPWTSIIAEHFPEEGLGRAINDRLRRASVKRR